MTNPAPGSLAWFEVATSDPDGAEKFYGSLFDWTFEADGPAASGGMDYRNIKAPGAERPMGGVFGTGGQVPDHAVFYILVADVEATCVRITGLLTHPLLSEGSATLAVACGYAGAPGDRLDVSQPVRRRAHPRQCARLPRRDGGPPGAPRHRCSSAGVP